MITIYGAFRSRATRNIWLMNELGQPFEHVPILQAYRLKDPLAPGAPVNTKSPAFLAINPNGHIPSMKDGDLVLHESLAINLYLARKFGGPLGAADLAEDGLFAMWTLWAATEVEPTVFHILVHRVMKPEGERIAKLADDAEIALAGPFKVLNEALAKDGWLVGGRFTMADINVAEVIRYGMAAPKLFAANPNVKAWLDKLHARPAFREMMTKREAEPA